MITTHFVYKNLSRFFIRFPDKCLGFSLELLSEFTKIVLIPFGHIRGCLHVKSVFSKDILKYFIPLKGSLNY